jgi:hypothetical protein
MNSPKAPEGRKVLSPFQGSVVESRSIARGSASLHPWLPSIAASRLQEFWSLKATFASSSPIFHLFLHGIGFTARLYLQGKEFQRKPVPIPAFFRQYSLRSAIIVRIAAPARLLKMCKDREISGALGAVPDHNDSSGNRRTLPALRLATEEAR